MCTFTAFRYGLELMQLKGQHDGTVKGVRYFECPKGYGIHCHANMLSDSKKISFIKGPDNESKGNVAAESKRNDDADPYDGLVIISSVNAHILTVHITESLHGDTLLIIVRVIALDTPYWNSRCFLLLKCV